MAANDKKDADAGASAATDDTPKPSKGPLILALVNSLAVLGVLGLLVYTRMVYKRPAITEHSERARIAAAQASPTPPPVPGYITFDPITVNIAATPDEPLPADGTARQIKGKLHYVTMGFALELRDLAISPKVEALKPILMDRMLSMLGRKSFHELTTPQGRYVLRIQIMELANELALKDAVLRDAIVTNVAFTHFIVQ